MTEPRKIKTFKDTNYFTHGTYKREFKDYMTEIGLVNIATRFVLAPIERWRIIKQTQVAYPLRPAQFKNSIDYISSNFSFMQEYPRNKDCRPSGGEIWPVYGCI